MKKYIIISMVILLIVFTILYHQPDHKYFTASATSLKGNTVDVEFDLYYQKFFFRPTEIYGEIIVDGRTFQLQRNKYMIERGNILERISAKIDNTIHRSYETQLFILEQPIGKIDNFQQIWYQPNSQYFDLLIILKDEFQDSRYIGPASTVAEVEALLLD